MSKLTNTELDDLTEELFGLSETQLTDILTEDEQERYLEIVETLIVNGREISFGLETLNL